MELKKRYSTMVFPQGFNGTHLALNIVLIPRNQNPFLPYNTGLASHPTAVPFAELQPRFEVSVSQGLDEWPIGNATSPGRIPVAFPVSVEPAANKQQVLQSIANQFGEKINLDGSTAAKTDQAEKLEKTMLTPVQKYLPESYRGAFNFTNPRHPNAKLDDSYHCALKKDTKKKEDWKTKDDLSWGQVFAHILRQPALARACGMIYSASIDLSAQPELLEKGGYVFVNITNNDYAAIQTGLLEDAEGPFVKRYAARIPALTPGEARPVFAPMLFPVLHRKSSEVVDPEPPKAEWDKIFAELNEYNDGYAKIVHAAQQVSSNILSERQDESSPQTDTGIRMAWDDEQIMIWYIRQLAENPAAPGTRTDVPIGVYGYRIDVREDEENSEWASLNLVRNKQQLMVGNVPIGSAANETTELPFQVFPSQLDNDLQSPYWLPMYFTNWIGKSLVLKDLDAIRINRHAEANKAWNSPEAKAVDESSPYDEVPPGFDMRYGNRYEFRVRMMDISGGGPSIETGLFNNAPSPSAIHHFKRYIAPDLCRIEKPEKFRTGLSSYFNKESEDENGPSIPNPAFRIRRPLLNYPAVVFTGKYQSAGLDPVDLLIASTHTGDENLVPGIADPDVTHVEISVEVESLKLDNLLSASGQENYLPLYTTTRAFPADFNAEINLPIVFHDVNVLQPGNPDDPFGEPALDKTAIDNMTEIPLPTARRLRVTVTAVCEGDGGYFGFINNANKQLDTRYGKPFQCWFHQPSTAETDLLLPKANTPQLQGVYLQPDQPFLNTGKVSSFLLMREKEGGMPDIVQRFAQQLGLRNNGMTLMGKKGERVVFGCSNRIRHQLSPDHGSITLSSKGDLCNHWLGCVVYRLNRDWTWNGLENTSFVLSRKKKFTRDNAAEEEVVKSLGDIEIKRSASFESLLPDEFGNINRDTTTLIFIDAIEPKSSLEKTGGGLRFPDEIEVSYEITPRFRPNHGTTSPIPSETLRLPTTIAPAQVPDIASLGIAFSPYRTNEKYSATEPRRKFLWVELKEPVKDPHDTLFCRVLAYAPDQLLSNNNLSLIGDVPEEPPLPVDPEYIRAITPGQTDDMAGLGAMQAMEKAADDDDIHYLLPLPPGLHAESPELFGFFTYEFRIGHGHWSQQEDEKGHLWSTAQGRFGRPLRVTGMQHPAPQLLCNVNRDADKLYLTAPYAKAVWNGRNVTADPPRTQLHGLLYAQVKQADGNGFRNILLDERLLMPDQQRPAIRDPKSRTEHYSMLRWTVDQVDEPQRANVMISHLAVMEDLDIETLKLDAFTSKKVQTALRARKAGKIENLDSASSARLLKALQDLELKDAPVATPAPQAQYNAGDKFTAATQLAGANLAIFKDVTKTATATWTNKEISYLLEQLGLPDDSPLSVLSVEVFGNITNIFEHLGLPMDQVLQISDRMPTIMKEAQERKRRQQLALSDELGNFRILRTSPLTEVPFVCCATC